MSKYKSKLVVAAIDFGTTYSGYAYSFKDEYERDPLKIYTNLGWSDGEGMTSKAPTVVLFDKTGKFHSFGYDAENQYYELSESDEHIGWMYFRRFKMALHNKRSLSISMELTDDQGRKMPAIYVFAAAIKYLKDQIMRRLADQMTGIKETDIQWVLTVPAIWDEPAKQFMCAAAYKAGIPADQLEIAREPEAAAIYCKKLTVSKAKEQGKHVQLKTFDPGAQFMLLDLGGGTMDITAHEVQTDGTLKELNQPSGGPWGGTLVDNFINELFESLFEKTVMDTFKKTSKPDDLILQRALEMKKRICSPTVSESAKVVIRIPIALYDTFQEKKGKGFEAVLKKSVYAKSVTKQNEKLKFETAIFLKCFEHSKESLLNHVRDLLQKPQLRNIQTIIMVGGFSESEVLKAAVKSGFQDRLNVIIPDNPGIAVMLGAVMYGHNTNSISSRIISNTYGISTAVTFDEKKHPMSKRVYRDGQYKCEDAFKVFIRAGTTVVPNQTKVEHTLTAPFVGASKACIEIYRSESETPMFVSDSDCSRIGEIAITLMKQPADQKQMIDVVMWFGDTMLHVEARETGTNNRAYAEFKCLKET